jgi:hypothetical protein
VFDFESAAKNPGEQGVQSWLSDTLAVVPGMHGKHDAWIFSG